MNVRFGSGPLTARYDAALRFAADAHRGQTRKNGDVPYISHLLRVSGLVLDYGGSEEAAIAALLHDAVEDCGGIATLEEIRALFGDEVAEIVQQTTDSTASNPKEKAPWRIRKEAYIARLVNVNESAALVCACDKVDNVTSLIRALNTCGNMEILEKFKGGREGQFWYFESIVNVLEQRNSPVAEELRSAVGVLKDLWKEKEV